MMSHLVAESRNFMKALRQVQFNFMLVSDQINEAMLKLKFTSKFLVVLTTSI